MSGGQCNHWNKKKIFLKISPLMKIELSSVKLCKHIFYFSLKICFVENRLMSNTWSKFYSKEWSVNDVHEDHTNRNLPGSGPLGQVCTSTSNRCNARSIVLWMDIQHLQRNRTSVADFYGPVNLLWLHQVRSVTLSTLFLARLQYFCQ